MFDFFNIDFIGWLRSVGIPEDWALVVIDFSEFIITFLLALIAYFAGKMAILGFIKRVAKRTSTNWDDILLEKRFFNRIAYIIPAWILYTATPYILAAHPDISTFIQKGISIYVIIVITLVVMSFLDSAHEIYNQFPNSTSRPITGYIQVAKIIIYIICSVFILSVFLNQKAGILFGGLGAFSAVLLLVFKDSILGFVAGLQISSNDMLQKGDWISMQSFNTDGIVIDITLAVVKIRNWDNTISTVPTYNMITDSFVNYRYMQNSGARRIRRSVTIDQNSIQFCTAEMIKKFASVEMIRDYVTGKEEELAEYNLEHGYDPTHPVNARRQTNIGVFRNYLQAYLFNNQHIRQDLGIIVRQLPSTELGLPMEISCFCRYTDTIPFENVQSDIFDHLLAVIPFFGLTLYQRPGGNDFRQVTD